MSDKKMTKTEDEWRKTLNPKQYEVLREKGTEAPFSGEYYDTTEPGVYKCAGCGTVLFHSDAKYDAGCGWPSFYQAFDDGKIIKQRDESHGMVRTEVLCATCGGHLGHLFDDGPSEHGGKRYCINSAALNLQKKDS